MAKNPYVLIVTLNGRNVKRIKFADYEKAEREMYNLSRKYPEFQGYEIYIQERI